MCNEPLKPCPFCGGTASLDFTPKKSLLVYVRCEKCNATGQYYPETKKNGGFEGAAKLAVKAWNNRLPNTCTLIQDEDFWLNAQCSACGSYLNLGQTCGSYCPMCGAKIEKR